MGSVGALTQAAARLNKLGEIKRFFNFSSRQDYPFGTSQIPFAFNDLLQNVLSD
jgi:hypothetical protein